MCNNLYTPDGWPNIEYIDGLGCWLNILISSRQVGKTYSTLKYMLENDRFHLFMRRTKAEFEAITSNPIMNPYEKFAKEGKHVMLTGSANSIMQVEGYDQGENGERVKNGKLYGAATSLVKIAAVRGFNGDAFSDWVFDEFIPEKIVVTRKAEGDAFLNAHVTINSNRELEGKPPIKTWLLANTNNINSPILNALRITDDILYARRKGLEEYITDNGIFIGQFKSEKILSQRKQTALMRQVGEDSEFYRMAINNEFSYDDSPYVKPISIKNARPAWSYGNMFCWAKADIFYICRAPFKTPNAPAYSTDATGRERLYLEHLYMKQYYYAGAVLFADLKIAADFKQLFNIA